MTQYETEQEQFWAGEFGVDYIDRNRDSQLLASNLALFARMLESTVEVESIVEFGCNIGMNLEALRLLLPGVALAGIEINASAAAELRQRLPDAEVFEDSLLGWTPDRQRDLVFTKGVLIHINPDKLPEVYGALHASSSRYIAIIEYYNPTPMSITYRGHDDRLFKRDFAGELLERFPDLSLVAHGFASKHSRHFPQDDLNWFLLEKRS